LTMPALTEYSVDLEVFQGPLDLLLYLLKLLNLDNAGEYILVAATLIRIKSRMLLPRGIDDDDSADPREELTTALLEYGKFREAGEILREKREFESRLVCVSGSNGDRSSGAVLDRSTTLFDLLTAFHEIMEGFRDESTYLIDRQEITIEDRIEVILRKLEDKQFATFEELFADVRVKVIAIVTFAAILEMVKTRQITIRQSVAFSEIRVYRTDRFSRPVPEVENHQDKSETLAQVAVES
jgi:segregation and condensation protein A